MTAEIAFWAAVGLVGYSYLVYPLVMTIIVRASSAAPSPTATGLPSVAVVVAAHNEERHIDARIRNLLELDYDPQRLRVYVGSDGSSDRTVAVANLYASSTVRVFAFTPRRGKASVLNDLVAAATEDIVVFTDANTLFDASAVRALVRHFGDSRVGAVSGELRLRKPRAGDNQDSSYWRIETILKRGESLIGGLLGANGGIYAIRRELYRALPGDTIVDDFTIVMNISALGHRTAFEPAALAFEDVPEGIPVEFRRRIRIGIGNYQAFFRYPEYWLRATWQRRFTYFSHKVLRWFAPHLLIVALASSWLLAADPFYAWLLKAQLFGYALLGLGLLTRERIAFPPLISAPLFVFALNVAFMVAFWRYLRGNVSAQWHRTERA